MQRIPLNIYWIGLKLLRVCQFPGSQAEYHRSPDRRTARAVAVVRKNDDGKVVGGVTCTWHAGLPSAPSALPSQASLALTVPEARYLTARILENHRQPLFAFMLDRDYVDADAEFAWEHPVSESQFNLLEVPARPRLGSGTALDRTRDVPNSIARTSLALLTAYPP